MHKFEEIKLISCDLDGTILNFKGQPGEETKKVINILHQKGIVLVANSGRPIHSIPDAILKLPFDYIVCMNGQYIFNTKTKEVIEKETLKPYELITLHNLALKNNCFSNLHYQKITYLITSPGQFIFAFIFDLLNRARFVFKQRAHTKTVFSLDINQLPLDDIAKICFISTNNNLKKLKKAIEALPDKPYHGFFVAKNWLEVQPSNVSKGKAVKDICKQENISLDNTMAFGDGENDISMLETVKYGVCMENGMPETKKIADYTAPSFLDDGFAKFIRENLL